LTGAAAPPGPGRRRNVSEAQLRSDLGDDIRRHLDDRLVQGLRFVGRRVRKRERLGFGLWHLDLLGSRLRRPAARVDRGPGQIPQRDHLDVLREEHDRLRGKADDEEEQMEEERDEQRHPQSTLVVRIVRFKINVVGINRPRRRGEGAEPEKLQRRIAPLVPALFVIHRVNFRISRGSDQACGSPAL
jgi:hypothetical protein